MDKCQEYKAGYEKYQPMQLTTLSDNEEELVII